MMLHMKSSRPYGKSVMGIMGLILRLYFTALFVKGVL